jgi:WASH complex subunit 7
MTAALWRPLCAQLETELRIQTRSHLQPTDWKPFRSDFSSLRDQLQDASLPIGRQELNAYVEQHLGQTLDNLAAVA